MMLVGFVSDRAIFRPLRRKAHLSILIATAGLSIAISNGLYLTFGPSPWGASSPFPMKMLSVLGAETAVLNQNRLAVDLAARALDNQVALMRALGGGYQGDAALAAIIARP